MNALNPEIAATESLLAFWRDAGVDACFEDAPVDRTFVARPARAEGDAESRCGGHRPDQYSAARSAEARRLAAEAADLDALKEAIAAFTGCPLRDMGASQAVFARGDPKAPILVIGEGPGADEDAQGAPFVGRAGKLLDRMLDAAGLLDKVFITNTVFWRPPGNRTPTPQEQMVCAPFVERAFALIQPKAVLLLGAAAAKSVLKTDEGIMKMRGQWREWRLNEGGRRGPGPADPAPGVPSAPAHGQAHGLGRRSGPGGETGHAGLTLSP